MYIERFEQMLSPQVTLPVRLVDVAWQPIAQEILEALEHPAMWYALRQLQPEDRADMLDGKTLALDRLAGHFLWWFYEKVRRRHTDWNREDVTEVMLAIALRASAARAAQYPFSIWQDVGHGNYVLRGRQVYLYLYREALSAGVIRETEPGMWDWRHPFVGRFLAREAAEEGL